MLYGQKSLKINMFFNALKAFMRVIFPLITFPYSSKILGVDAIGAYNFCASVISYFVLIAGLGIETYAIREGSKLRENKIEFEKFANQIFSINVVTTIISYGLLVLVLCFSTKLQEYYLMLLILSIQIAFTTVGIEWVYSVFENFAFITLRTFIFQVISVVLLFTLVKSPEDVLSYSAIIVFASVGSNIINFLYSRKYFCVRFTLKMNLSEHIKPILIMFAMAVTITIYVTTDTTILGFICGDKTVGIYSVSNKLYGIIKTLLSAILVVSIPRLSNIYGSHNYVFFNETATDIYKTLWTILLPSVTGMLLLRKDIIMLIASEEYLPASTSFSILSVALIFCMTAWFWAQCILVPMGLEKEVFKATLLSAVVNLILNFLLIPIWAEKAAAFTTLLAQAVEFIWCYCVAKKQFQLHGVGGCIFKCLIGCSSIIIICCFLRCIDNRILYVSLSVIGSVVSYFVIETILKNETISPLISKVANKFNVHII